MATTVNIRKAIKSKLASLIAAEYYQTARGSTPDTYAVWTLTDVTYDELLNQAELEVTLVSRGDNSSDIEALADSVWSALDHWTYYNKTTKVAFTSYPSVRNVLSEDDKQILKRRITFTVRIYGG